MVIIGHDQGRVDSNFYQASIFVLIVLFMWQVLIFSLPCEKNLNILCYPGP